MVSGCFFQVITINIAAFQDWKQTKGWNQPDISKDYFNTRRSCRQIKKDPLNNSWIGNLSNRNKSVIAVIIKPFPVFRFLKVVTWRLTSQLIQSSEVFRLQPLLFYVFSTSSEIQLSCFLLLALKIERISSSWVIHYSAATCLFSLLTLVIFKLKGVGLKRRGVWMSGMKTGRELWGAKVRGDMRKERVRQINGQTDYKDKESVWRRGVSNVTKADLKEVRQCDHL